jgi:type IV pilus assembly protein PilY1
VYQAIVFLPLLGAILAGISNQRKSRSGAAFSGQVLSTANDIIYEPTIEQGWGGDLLKVQIETDPTSVFPPPGAEIATVWHAAAVLASQIKPAFLGDEPWFDESKRRVVTWNGAAKAAFRAVPGGTMATVLSNLQLQTLSLDPLTQKKMVAYLRGGTTYTVPNPVPPPANVVLTIEGTGIGQFRKRIGGALGDLSNAQPLVVSAPANPIIFNTGADPGYQAYADLWNPIPVPPALPSGRPDRIVAPANDGMVHVFDSADGHEIMAYIPSSLLRTTVDAAGKATGLQALTYQDGGVRFTGTTSVDSSPRTSDVDFNSAGVKGGASDWRTIVVGGMGKGGGSYYGLDLTRPTPWTSRRPRQALWEFHDADWNYTYGHPVIVKTYAYGWTVIVTSGYNNVSERAGSTSSIPRMARSCARS